MTKDILSTILKLTASFLVVMFLVFAIDQLRAQSADGPTDQPNGEVTPDANPKPPLATREGEMNLATMRTLIKRLDEKAAEPRPGTFSFLVEDYEVNIFTSVPANRMRVMIRIRNADQLTKEELLRISQANLDAALDARYAVGSGALWSTFIHPLSTLHPRQFLEGIGATVNLAATYGSTYTSGQVIFGGGDSSNIIRRKLIDSLIEKGQKI